MNKYLKYVLPLLVTLLLGWFLLHKGIRWNELQSVLSQAKWSMLVLAFVFQMTSFSAVTYLNQILLQGYGTVVPYGKQLMVQLAMAFIESVIPSASVSGVMLRARLLKPHGVSADVAAATVVMEGTLILASVILPTAAITGYALYNNLYNYRLLSRSLILFGVMLSITSITISHWNTQFFVRLRAQNLQKLTHFWEEHIQARWPRFFGNWSVKRIVQRIRYLWKEAGASLRNHPYAITISLVARFGFEAMCLVTCFIALGQELPAVSFLLIYALTIAINTLGALPGGIGLAEVTLSTFYTQLGISTETAVTIALTYRVVGYWLPRLIGGLAWLLTEQMLMS